MESRSKRKAAKQMEKLRLQCGAEKAVAARGAARQRLQCGNGQGVAKRRQAKRKRSSASSSFTALSFLPEVEADGVTGSAFVGRFATLVDLGDVATSPVGILWTRCPHTIATQQAKTATDVGHQQ